MNVLRLSAWVALAALVPAFPATPARAQCSPDVRGPVVVAPSYVFVAQSACVGGLAGASSTTSPALAAFLAGGGAADDCDPQPQRLPALRADGSAAAGTLFASGTHRIDFRWRDATGNVGTAPSFVTVVVGGGDLDLDTQVGATDALILASHLAGRIAPGNAPFTAGPAAADVDRSGSANAADLARLLAWIAGNVACLPGDDEAAAGTTWYVRSDGGSPAQCNGRADAPYPGSGADRPCAWDHPFRALPPGGPARIAGGDTVIVGPGSYRMGFGAPETGGSDGDCTRDSAWACFMTALPSGPSAAQPTRLLGKGWDSGCTAPPQLWGTERTDAILVLNGTSNAEVACFEITDRSSCVEFHSGAIPCQRDSAPFGDWAATGIEAVDSANVRLADLDVHGLASMGMHAARLTDWTLERVRLAANGSAGWDGDVPGDDSNSGTITLRRVTIEWNGCGETWPGGEPTGCWAQSAGGYGDGLGTGTTGGDWVIEDSLFADNTSDGLDLLYADPSASIVVRRTVARGNAGNQIKTSGTARIENSLLISDCGAFIGKPYTFDVDPCRAGGNALSVSLFRGQRAEVVSSTITGEGDCLGVAVCSTNDDAEPCDGSERLLMRNVVFQGQEEYLVPGERTCLVYTEGFPHEVLDIDFSVIADVKDDPCPGANDRCVPDAGLVDERLTTFDAHLKATSPAVGTAQVSSSPPDDIDGLPRDAQPDRGAYERR